MSLSVDCIDCCDDGLGLIQNFEDRLITFVSWHGKVSAKDLAKAGFYFLQQPDVVKCAFCCCEFDNWKQGDDPLADHYKYAKYCKLAQVLWNSRQFKNLATESLNVNEKKYTMGKFNLFYVILTIMLFISGVFQLQESIKVIKREI